MSRVVHTDLHSLHALIRADLAAMVANVEEALVIVAHEEAPKIIKENVPVAFGELRDGVEGKGGPGNLKTVVDAPHAAAVEIGSEPHYPNIEKLRRWVELRNIQGHTKAGGLRKKFPRSWGPTTVEHATRIASQVESKTTAGMSAEAAIDQITLAIAHSIATNGTRPHHYVAKSLPAIEKSLDTHIKAKIKT